MSLLGTYTLFSKEIRRFGKVAAQTLLAPAIMASLYLLIFSHLLEERVPKPGVRYEVFLIPGLMMMTLIQNAFANSSASLIQSKVTGNLVFVLLAPLSPAEILVAFVLAAVVRGCVVGAVVYLVSCLVVDVEVFRFGYVVAFALLAGAVMGTLGFLAALWAERFDQVAAFQSFVVVPLSFLSGVFYSVDSLPAFWQRASRLNPFFYMVDGFRYGFIGRSDIAPTTSLVIVAGFLLLIASFTVWLVDRGYRIRS
ncbi:MAG: ABC transporter permease [Pseudomonadota bacterium]